MEYSLGTGFVAVFAVSGSVVLLALQAHKRLLSDFMKKMEFEMVTTKKSEEKKMRVRFADKYTAKKPIPVTRKLGIPTEGPREEKLEALPLNWQALYKGMIQNRVVKELRLKEL